MSLSSPDRKLAYDTPHGRAWYVAGSALAGEAQYELAGRVLGGGMDDCGA